MAKIILTNLYEETTAKIRKHGYSWRNVLMVRNKEGYIPIAEFVERSRLIDYNQKDEIVHIDPSLRIIGKFWWLQRIDINGQEGWLFCKKPSKPLLPSSDYRLENVGHEQTNWNELLWGDQ